MTNEQKQLLLKDLCARLPYGVIAYASEINKNGSITDVNIPYNMVNLTVDNAGAKYELIPLFDIKPYLRPMSSMTKEEKDELNSISYEFGFEWIDAEIAEEKYIASAKMQSRSIDFYNANHFDYRGLIPMGLALEAPEDMYKTE